MTAIQKFLYTTTANIIFLFHLLLVIVVSVGWMFPSLFYVFILFLAGTAISEIVFGYCIFTKWEFYFRRKVHPEKQFDSSCIFHYGRGLFGLPPRVPSNKLEKGFLIRYSSLLVLLLPLMGAVIVRFN